MAEQNLQSLQKSINEKGYSWQAGRTSVSDLSVAEQKAILGLDVDPKELAATREVIRAAGRLQALEAPLALPTSIDWRSNGGNWVTPIKDQLSCGSCVSFATLATIESHLRLACKNASLDIDLAEAHLFYCGCGNCCVPGWNFVPALEYCKNTGVAREADFPYTPGNQPCKPGVPILVKINSWSKALTAAERKNYLAATGPMVGGFEVFADFYAYQSGVYRHTSGAHRGYHAISVVGYDDAQQCWICKNSWGPAWGDSGFFRIGYGECDIDSGFAFYGVAVECPPQPQPTDICARYAPFLVRVLNAARVNRELRACLCYYVCGRGPRPRCSTATTNIVRLVLLILQRCPRYRAPFCARLAC
jgi:C1A family cysteine protease